MRVRFLQRTLITLVMLFGAIQLIRPSRVNPPIDESRTLQARTQVSPEINAVLERSCNDCHSDKTHWPWYSNIAPFSWYLVHDVNEGRAELSFSNWGGYTARRAARKLQEFCEQIEKGAMPLKAYVFLHRDAKLSDAEKKLLCAWTNQERARLTANQTVSRRTR
jgi:hypothetical protein